MSGISRRTFLAGSAGIWITATMPRPLAAQAAERSSRPERLSELEWRTVDAIAARIIPTDHEPGAREAGCVNFIDKALMNEDAAALPLYREALAALVRESLERHAVEFAELDAGRQDGMIAELERAATPYWPEGDARPEDFFQTIRLHTILGFLSDPRHGGNRDHAGWKVVGFPGPIHHRGGARPEHMTGVVPFAPIWSTADDRRHGRG